MKRSMVSLRALKDQYFTWQNAVVFALVAIPAIAMLVVLVHNSVNVPFWDQWSYVELLEKIHNNHFSFFDLWKQHNEHRILVPKAILLMLAKFTDYNVRYEVLLNLAASCGSVLVIASLLKRSFPKRQTLRGALLVVSAWLILSPLAWINWIWGFQFAFFLGVFTVLLTVWFLLDFYLNPKTARSFFLAIIAAAIATYSLGNGMVIWPIGFALLLANGTTREFLKNWSLAGLLVLSTYFYKFHRSPDSPRFSELIKQPVAVMRYVLQNLGHPLARTPEGAKYTGIFLLICFVVGAVYLWRSKQEMLVKIWVSVGGYALMTAILAALSRLNFGLEHSMSFSYVTSSTIFTVATIILAVTALLEYCKRVSSKQRMISYLLVFILGVATFPTTLSFIQNYKRGLLEIRQQSAHLHRVRQCVDTASSIDDPCLEIVYPLRDTAWHDVQYLRSR
jgi:hypothetical protein